MQAPKHDYLVMLIEEQRLKQLAIDEQVRLELLNLNEPEAAKTMRREYMEFLANRILSIQYQLDDWLNSVDLPLNWIV